MELIPKDLENMDVFQTHKTYCQAAFVCGVFPFTLPAEYDLLAVAVFHSNWPGFQFYICQPRARLPSFLALSFLTEGEEAGGFTAKMCVSILYD